MPYKNIEDKRAHRRRWMKKHREDIKKIKARLIAERVYTDPQSCIIKNCTKLGQRHHPDYDQPDVIIWLCPKHHNLLHSKEKRICVVENCTNQHFAKGLCQPHYGKMRYYVKIP